MKRKDSILIIGIILAVFTRVVTAIYFGDKVEVLPGTADQVSYHALAIRVIQGHGFSFGEPWWPLTAANAPTAHWSYLYTLYLVFVYSVFGIHPLAARLLQAVIVGVLQPMLVYRLGYRAFDTAVGLWAAVLTALYPYFIYYAAMLMTESFYIVGILGCFYLAISLTDLIKAEFSQKKRFSFFMLGISLGLCLAATILLRQLFLLFIPVLFGWMIIATGRKYIKQMGSSIAISGLVIVIIILPITISNYQRFHRFVLLNTNAGFAFYWANHPIYGTKFIPILPADMGTYGDLIPKDLRKLDEAALDQALMKEGFRIVREDPKRYVLLSISRIPSYFMFWPTRESDLISNIARVGGFGLLLPFILYGIVRSTIEKNPVRKYKISSSVFLIHLFVLSYSIIHILSWTLIRYRLPVDSVLVILAGLAFVDLMNYLRYSMGYENSFLRSLSS